MKHVILESKLAKILVLILLTSTVYKCTFDDIISTTYDGLYCAIITYQNSRTGTSSEYELKIEVENNELSKILWPNGGWLDQDHFHPVEFDKDGYCEFVSDKDYEYTIQIISKNCDNSTDAYKLQDQIIYDRELTLCTRCQSEKDRFEEYCDECNEKLCLKCGQFDNSKYYTDDLCYNCERKDKTCIRCGTYDRWMSKFDDFCSDCN